jgi:hypothetical protein
MTRGSRRRVGTPMQPEVGFAQSAGSTPFSSRNAFASLWPQQYTSFVSEIAQKPALEPLAPVIDVPARKKVLAMSV